MKILLTPMGFHNPFAEASIAGEKEAGPVLKVASERLFDRVYLFPYGVNLVAVEKAPVTGKSSSASAQPFGSANEEAYRQENERTINEP
jgi:hypothetical protein